MTEYIISPYTGEEINVAQPYLNTGNWEKRRWHQWLCLRCGYRWQGHKRIWYEGRKPDRCPKCKQQKKEQIVKVRK